MTERDFFNAVLAIENIPIEVKEYAETELIKLKKHNKNRMIAAAEVGKTLDDISFSKTSVQQIDNVENIKIKIPNKCKCKCCKIK